MIQVVIGKNDRIIATHPVSEEIDMSAYDGVKAKGEKLEVVTVADDAIITDVEIGLDYIPTGKSSRRLADGWRS